MVARTGGRLLDPRAATTFAGTSIPVAVFPACRILVRNLIAGLGFRPGDFSALQRLWYTVVGSRELNDSEVVAKRVADSEIGAVEMLFRLRGELDALRLQR